MFKLIIVAFGINLIYVLEIGGTSKDNDWPRANYKTEPIAAKNFSISSDLVRQFLEHFKNPDSSNLPLPIPDPLVMPDRVYPFPYVKINTTRVMAYGISRVKIENFTSDIVQMELHFVLRLPKVELLGSYSYDSLFEHFSGAFNVTITNGYMESNARLEINRDGELAATDIKMDMLSSDDIAISMENAGILGAFLRTFGNSFFDFIKPYFFSLMGNNVRSTLNEGLRRFKVMFPNSIAPIDLGVAELRKFAKTSGFDPLRVQDYQYASGIYSVDLTDIVVTGLSTVYRSGDVRLRMENNVVNVLSTAETETLEGSCAWEASVAGVFSRSGVASFAVDYVAVTLSVNQSLDIRRKPKVADVKVTLGNIQLRMDGAGTLDYFAEFGVNVLPNALRYQILQAAETPMRRKMQESLDDTDVERLVADNLSKMDDQLYRRNVTKIEDNFVDAESPPKQNTLYEDYDLQ